MKKRTKILSVLMAGAMAGTIALSSCSLVASDPQADMNQVIAEVDITQSDKLSDIKNSSYWSSSYSISDFAGAITSTSVYKRDLVAFFLGSASSLLSDGTTTYGEAFETLAETLVQNEILIQFTTIATLAAMVEDDSCSEVTLPEAAVEKFNSFSTDAARYEWLLDYQSNKYNSYKNSSTSTYESNSDNSKTDFVLLVKYTLYSSINSTIDDYEKDYLDIDDDDDESSATLPTNVDTEVENYYPVKSGSSNNQELDYGIYTGYSGYLISDSGAYAEDKLTGSTIYTRQKAYQDFINLLDSNYLITDDDDIRDVLSLDYVQSQYVNLLCEQMISNYFDLYECELEKEIANGNYDWIQKKYDELLAEQTATYSNSASALETAASNMGSDSFILYVPDSENGNKFGYVYNILLGFSQSQSDALTALSNQLDNDVISEDEYYYYRNQLLKNVVATDQRSDWFNGGIDYSFDASGSELNYYRGSSSTYDSRTILFFENNLTNSERYESLEKYYGMYTYNGIAIQTESGDYILMPNELSIDDMMSEIAGYINFVAEKEEINTNTASPLDGATSLGVLRWIYNSLDGNSNNFYDKKTFVENGKVDYEKFIYAYGKIDFSEYSASDLMNPESDSYKIMSAVSELQYAYTTDTSVLSEYVGYSVSAYSTDYVAEFEYACQKAIDMGVGTFMVVATDYGWHIIYVTYVLDAPESDGYVYGPVPDWSRINTEGTFENLFYEMLRSSALDTYTTECQSYLLQMLYDEDLTVTLYKSRYSDLTSLTSTYSS